MGQLGVGAPQLLGDVAKSNTSIHGCRGVGVAAAVSLAVKHASALQSWFPKGLALEATVDSGACPYRLPDVVRHPGFQVEHPLREELRVLEDVSSPCLERVVPRHLNRTHRAAQVKNQEI